MRATDDQLRALQREHGPSLLAYFLRRAEPADDAAALLNDLLLIVWRKAASAPADPVEARMWMFGIARNLVSSHQRSGRRRAALSQKLREAIAEREPDVADDQRAAVRTAVAKLPDPQRELVRLVHWDGFTLAEAATITGVSASTARSRYQLARRRLAKELGAASEDPLPVRVVSYAAPGTSR